MPKKATQNHDVTANGFTLIEMLVAVLIVGVLLLVAAPGFSDLISNNRMVSEVYLMRATLSHARSEALARRAPVVVCPTTDGLACADSNDWSSGYMTFVDTDDNNVANPTDPDEDIIQWEARQSPVDILFDNASKRVRFGGQGVALGFEGTFTFCDSRGAGDARALILNPVGSLRAALDIDATPDATPDGIVNALDDTNVVCN
jgi:type IV fimbrial biogenesis protein FimT